MKYFITLALLLWVALPASLVNAAQQAEAVDFSQYKIAIQDPSTLHSSTGGAFASKAASDTFYIYGGPGSLEGMFQTLPGVPGGAPDAQGWTTHDLTEQNPRWRASTINSESPADGNPHGFSGLVGNHGVISNHDGADYFGYGNSWDDWLVFNYDISAGDPGFDPGVDNTAVRYTCEYKHDTEEVYDLLIFEWSRGGAIQELFSVDATSFNDSTGFYEKRDFDSDDYGGILYTPGDYIDGTYIQLRVRVLSDGGWSDEDGLVNTNGRGAAALDNISVYVNGGLISMADFEPLGAKADLGEGDVSGHNNGATSGSVGWTPTPSNFVGDFAKLLSGFQDIDPCRSNETPQWGFINDGTPPNNAPGQSVAPAISPTWTYGVPGGYVVDFNGGLTNGASSLNNEIWSPEIEWDLPGSEDDVANGGAVLGYTRWSHLPLINGIFAIWQIRSFDGVDWSGWESNNLVYYDPDGIWGNYTIDVTDKMVQGIERVQISMGSLDLADGFAFPGNDATPAPLFDNIYLKKYVIGGPVITARTIDLASDCFPIDGTKTGSLRFDANIDRNANVLVPGDSIVAEIKAIIPGSALADPLIGGDIVVRQLLNPDFSSARAAGVSAVGGSVIGTDPQSGWDILAYRVAGQQVTNNTGDVIEDRYYWDLPDGISNGLPHISDEDALFFPGDVIQFHLESSDDLGNTSTLPADIGGFGDFAEGNIYNRVFVVRGLPTLVQGVQPELLFWNDNGHRNGENDYLQAFRQNGLVEGVDYDTFTTKGPDSGVGNGLGSAGYHGANASQLDGYDSMVYVLGDLNTIAISDGTGEGDNDLSADLGTIESWANADADRYHAYFGDSFAESMVAQGAAAQTYLNTVLGVDLLSVDVVPEIDSQTSATILPTGQGSGSYVSDYVAYGGCLIINHFDQIGPFGVGPELAHEFTDPGGGSYPSPVAASIEWLRQDGSGNTKHSIVFPYDLRYIRDALGTSGTGVSARSRVLGEVFASWGKSLGGPAIGAPDLPSKLMVSQNYPNPFNPSTTIKFALPARGQVSVRVYNVRGELVSTLFDGVKGAGDHSLVWNGQDARGARVATGVYLYKVSAAGSEVVKKMALIK